MKDKIDKICPECGSLNLTKVKNKFRCMDCGLDFIEPKEKQKMDVLEALCWGGLVGGIVLPTLEK